MTVYRLGERPTIEHKPPGRAFKVDIRGIGPYDAIVDSAFPSNSPPGAFNSITAAINYYGSNDYEKCWLLVRPGEYDETDEDLDTGTIENLVIDGWIVGNGVSDRVLWSPKAGFTVDGLRMTNLRVDAAVATMTSLGATEMHLMAFTVYVQNNQGFILTAQYMEGHDVQVVQGSLTPQTITVNGDALNLTDLVVVGGGGGGSHSTLFSSDNGSIHGAILNSIPGGQNMTVFCQGNMDVHLTNTDTHKSGAGSSGPYLSFASGRITGSVSDIAILTCAGASVDLQLSDVDACHVEDGIVNLIGECQDLTVTGGEGSYTGHVHDFLAFTGQDGPWKVQCSRRGSTPNQVLYLASGITNGIFDIACASNGGESSVELYVIDSGANYNLVRMTGIGAGGVFAAGSDGGTGNVIQTV